MAEAAHSPPEEDGAEAVAELYRRYGLETYAFFRRRVGDPEIAADLNQDLYLSALGAYPRFRRESSIRTWLFGIAHHHLASLRRRWRTSLEESDASLGERVWRHVAANEGEGPEREAQRSELARLLRRCLARLSEVQRAVVLLHYRQGETLDQVTRRLRLTNPSGARAILLAAQRSLRRCMKRAGAQGSGGERATGRKP